MFPSEGVSQYLILAVRFSLSFNPSRREGRTIPFRKKTYYDHETRIRNNFNIINKLRRTVYNNPPNLKTYQQQGCFIQKLGSYLVFIKYPSNSMSLPFMSKHQQAITPPSPLKLSTSQLSLSLFQLKPTQI